MISQWFNWHINYFIVSTVYKNFIRNVEILKHCPSYDCYNICYNLIINRVISYFILFWRFKHYLIINFITIIILIIIINDNSRRWKLPRSKQKTWDLLQYIALLFIVIPLNCYPYRKKKLLYVHSISQPPLPHKIKIIASQHSISY